MLTPLSLEFQDLFNDHASKDINTLFRSVPPSHKYYAAGVLGSFYDRLFPKSSLHFVHCPYALHWMSRIPKQVLDCNWPALDKNNVHYVTASPELYEAYAAQFKNDMESFLNCRAEELVSGGFMVILMFGMPNHFILSETAEAVSFGFLESFLSEMVKLGLISQEKVDSFYVPQYFTTSQEFEALIEKNGNASIERTGYISPSVEFLVGAMRTTLGGLFKEKFGEEATEKLIERYTMKLAENYHLFESKFREHEDLFFILKCKKN